MFFLLPMVIQIIQHHFGSPLQKNVTLVLFFQKHVLYLSWVFLYFPNATTFFGGPFIGPTLMKPVRSVSASHLFAAQRYDAIASFHQKTIESLPGLSLIHTIYIIYNQIHHKGLYIYNQAMHINFIWFTIDTLWL